MKKILLALSFLLAFTGISQAQKYKFSTKVDEQAHMYSIKAEDNIGILVDRFKLQAVIDNMDEIDAYFQQEDADQMGEFSRKHRLAEWEGWIRHLYAKLHMKGWLGRPHMMLKDKEKRKIYIAVCTDEQFAQLREAQEDKTEVRVVLKHGVSMYRDGTVICTIKKIK